MAEKKSFWKNPWVIAIVGGIVVYVVGAFIVKWVDSVSFIDAVEVIAQWIWSGLSYNIPIWAFLLILIGLVILLIALLKVSTTNLITPAYLDYTRDKFDGVIFTWFWKKNIEGRFQISDLELLCPDCKIPLINEPAHIPRPEYFYCPQCIETFNITERRVRDIETIIRGRANNMIDQEE